MATLRELAIKNLEEQINQALEGLNRLWDDMEKMRADVPALDVPLPDNATVDASFLPTVTVPWNPEANQELVETLEAAGWRPMLAPRYNTEGPYGDYLGGTWDFMHDATFAHLVLRARTGKEGAVCQVVQVGTKMKEVPVYRIECA